VPLSRIDFTNIFEPEVAPYCGPLYFGVSLESPLEVTASGSFGLVDTGKRKLLITCRHVWDGLCTMREKAPALKMFVYLRTGPPVVFDPAPIDADKHLDLATFDLEPILSACAGNRFYRLDQDPAPNLTKKDRLYFLGYPGHLRRVSSRLIEFSRVPYAVAVRSVDGFRFHCDISKAVYEDQSDRPAVDRHHGISGSPCFLLRKPGSKLRLAGFAVSLTFGNLGFVSARCVRSDGTLSRQGLRT
jgi:hypothetical protein